MARSLLISPRPNSFSPVIVAGRESGGDAAEDDAALLLRIGNGEHAAFAVLVRRYSDRFYRVAYRFIHNAADAEDVVQDAFIKLWERPGMWQMEKNAAFTTWFYRVIVNACLDRHKKKRPLQLIDDSWIEDSRETQDEGLSRRQQERWLETQLDALPERQRTALNLCFYEEVSNEDAAKIMGIRLKALQSLLMRAKMTLKEQWKEYSHARP